MTPYHVVQHGKDLRGVLGNWDAPYHVGTRTEHGPGLTRLSSVSIPPISFCYYVSAMDERLASAKTVPVFMRVPRATRKKRERLAARAQARHGGQKSLGRAVAMLVEESRKREAEHEAAG